MICKSIKPERADSLCLQPGSNNKCARRCGVGMVFKKQVYRGSYRRVSIVSSGNDYFCALTMFGKVLDPVGETGKHDSFFYRAQSLEETRQLLEVQDDSGSHVANGPNCAVTIIWGVFLLEALTLWGRRSGSWAPWSYFHKSPVSWCPLLSALNKRMRRTHVCLWPIHVDVWQKPLQYCKVIILRSK